MNVTARALDRQAGKAGGLLVPAAARPAGDCEALLVLADGSVWRGRTTTSSLGAVGEIAIVGETALIGADAVAFDAEGPLLRDHLAKTHALGRGGKVRGYLMAAGAWTPIHALVACAVARGEIGRP